MPIPLAISLLSTLGPAAAKYIGARKASDELKQSPEDIAKQYEELKSSMPQYGVGSAWNEYLAMSKQDPAADMQRQIAAEQEASSIGALKAGGAKALLGGLGASQRQAAQSRMGIEAGSAARQQAALGQYAGIQQAADMRNTMMQQQLAASQFQAERGAEQYNRYLEAGKKQALWEGLGSLAGSASSIYGAFQNRPNAGSKSKDAYSAIQEMGITIDPNQAAKTVMGDFGDMLNVGAEVTGLPTTDYYNPSFGSPQPLPWNQKSGGMITKGDFSHETNPIDIMQDGAKIGEMTGGEAILNPEQQNKVAKQSPYFRKLMREFAMRKKNG